MDRVMGIILAYSDRAAMRELTKVRTLASLPVAGKYRIIDFLLSGFVNSGIYDISVITNNNYHSLMDHLESGKNWDLMRKTGGLRLLTPLSRADYFTGEYKGTLDALNRNLYSIKKSDAEYIILSGSSIVCNLDYGEVMEEHIKSKADLTALYTRSLNGGKTVPRGVGVLKTNKDGRIYDLYINEDDVKLQDVNWCLEIFIMKKSLLETLVADAVSVGMTDFYMDVVKRLAATLNMKGIEVTEQFFEISDVKGYMRANMNFLNEEYRRKAFKRPVFTKIKDSVPTLYREGCYVSNSLISDGCKIEGTVINSILSRGVRVEQGAFVTDSIIMQNTDIKQGANVRYVISDKNVIIREGREVTGHEKYPVLIEKSTIV
ncbi:MAG: glucose-1-phosphate adenylyltransferase subunit GlgD [Anaerovoracaceae bacterium]